MIRTRFAPSPTGKLHIGGLRTALYAYLFARQGNGQVVLRIEDTDQKRFVEGATEHFIEVLHEFGIDFDESPKVGGPHGPYIQSERVERHREIAHKLVELKAAYKCFCTEEELEAMRENQAKAKQAPMYDRRSRHLSEEEVAEKEAAGLPYVIRLKVPLNEMIQFKDLVRGRVSFDAKTVDDTVLLKSDGFPTYHLANVVDDHDMKITHVIRGEEWLPSTPKHIILYKALGWDAPEFAHLPLILNKDRTKLSKRQNDVHVEAYLEKNYLKPTILNFIALLGWHPGKGEENEIFSLDELIQHFTMEKVHKAGAVFDIEKLNWFNWQWQRRLFLDELKTFAKNLDPNVTIQELKKGHFSYIFTNPEHTEKLMEKKKNLLLEIVKPHLKEEFLTNEGILKSALTTVEDKILKEPQEINEHIDFYFALPEYEKEILLHERMKVDLEMAQKALEKSLEDLEKISSTDFTNHTLLKETLVETVKALEVKNGQVFWPLRVALTGKEFSPGVFEVAATLGKDESLSRIKKCLDKLT